MGVPAFFRWLQKRYPLSVVHCKEEKTVILDGVKIPIDLSNPNPNGFEFDNLYLDMNGIIHPCCHPENKPAPNTEDEMMEAIFEYVDRLINIVRPRKVLYMAIDGVAPRAKMNQQRSRRFRATKESKELRETIAKIKEELRSKGAEVPPEKTDTEHFDSNCITPGTEFMSRLAKSLQSYIRKRMNDDPNFSQLEIILSDANVPGEGEHKIMDFIRRQRAQPNHDPNTKHCLCGADADLIMLGLATHEPNFTIIREEFKYNDRHCEICGQKNHKMTECTGLPKEKLGEFDEKEPVISSEVEFIFLRLNILREYLYKQLEFDNLPFKQDIERSIDDWVLLCFFVGNDFLPHLPSLEIKENAIDKLINLYQRVLRIFGRYLTDSGEIHWDSLILLLKFHADKEDEIFDKRHKNDLKSKEIYEDKKKMKLLQANVPLGNGFISQSQPASIKISSDEDINKMEICLEKKVVKNYVNLNEKPNSDLISDIDQNLDPNKEDEIPDDVKLWEKGWRERYYECKFGVGPENLENFRFNVGRDYLITISWVLKYYYQGCSSWDWYFPYHYAPFASDMKNISNLKVAFNGDTKPLRPLEQLMAVFPADSSKFLPPSWQELMIREDSEIIDFYPSDFKIDINGKRQAWQGVVLLPFVNKDLLLKTLETVYPNLTEDERIKNSLGHDLLFLHKSHPSFNLVDELYKRENNAESIELDTSLTHGMAGLVSCEDKSIQLGEVVKSPISHINDCHKDEVIFVRFKDPQYPSDYIFPSRLLSNATIPEPILKPEDFELIFKFKKTITDREIPNGHNNSRSYNHPNQPRENRSNLPHRRRDVHFDNKYEHNYGKKQRLDDGQDRFQNDEHRYRHDHRQEFQNSSSHGCNRTSDLDTQNNFGNHQHGNQSDNQRYGYENRNYHQNQRVERNSRSCIHNHNDRLMEYQINENRPDLLYQSDHRRGDRFPPHYEYQQRSENNYGQQRQNSYQRHDRGHTIESHESYQRSHQNRGHTNNQHHQNQFVPPKDERDHITINQNQPNPQHEQQEHYRRIQHHNESHERYQRSHQNRGHTNNQHHQNQFVPPKDERDHIMINQNQPNPQQEHYRRIQHHNESHERYQRSHQNRGHTNNQHYQNQFVPPRDERDHILINQNQSNLQHEQQENGRRVQYHNDNQSGCQRHQHMDNPPRKFHPYPRPN